jgi:hypothetical protein
MNVLLNVLLFNHKAVKALQDTYAFLVAIMQAPSILRQGSLPSHSTQQLLTNTQQFCPSGIQTFLAVQSVWSSKQQW